MLSAFWSTAASTRTTAWLGGQDLPLATAFLEEIQAQLRRHVDAQPILHVVVPSPTQRKPKEKKQTSIHVQQVQDEDEINEPRYPPCSSIKDQLSLFTTVYLVVDNLDVAWLYPQEYLALEEILSWLGHLGVRVLVTSRTYRQKSKRSGQCDVPEDEVDPEDHRDFCLDDPEREEGLVAWWRCSGCAREETDPANIYVVCEACKQKGYKCTKT